MTNHFTVIQPDGKKLIAVQVIIDPTDELQVKALIKSLRELITNSKDPINEEEVKPIQIPE